jgi:hypothetical protein
MALSGLTSLQTALATPFDRRAFLKTVVWSAQALAGNAWVSSWLSTPTPVTGVAPGSAGSMTARVCDRNTVGAIGQNNSSITTELRAFLNTISGSTGTLPQTFTLMLCDRLADCSSFDASLLTRQPTSLAAPTRYTPSTSSVRAAIETYVALSNATSVTGTLDYTNQNGTSGQTTPVLTISGGFAGAQATTLFKPLSLAAGDTGFTTVDGLTLASGALGATGNWGITLYKPLAMYLCVGGHEDVNSFAPLERLGGYLPLIKPDACLFWLFQASSTGTFNVQGEVGFLVD